jgi:hypothetical protein
LAQGADVLLELVERDGVVRVGGLVALFVGLARVWLPLRAAAS